MHLTWLDSNTWLMEIGKQQILIDPWLVDTLTFGNLDWLFKGSRTQNHPIPENIDLILLSQGLEDHTHPPTLKQLNRNIPVVGSANATKVVQELGYTTVTTLAHGETFTLNQSVEIKATKGSSLGPNLVENGYLIKDLESSLNLYYEPHGFHDPSLKLAAPVDVIITPIMNLALPLIGSIIKGKDTALEVAKWLQPQVMLPTATPGDVVYEGLLVNWLRAGGSIEDFRSQLAQNQLSTQVIEPKPREQFELQLQPRILTQSAMKSPPQPA
jgi:L-ascorbate metabolism protein UlaG (beta-lactamase superfamily)